MTTLSRHIAVLLMLAVFSLTMHVGVYHVPSADNDHATEHEHGKEHADSDTCIAGLAHVQLTITQSAPPVIWHLLGVVAVEASSSYFKGVELPHVGRAPPRDTTYITT
jgi:hypothetical protein